jgi:hypothetical protein
MRRLAQQRTTGSSKQAQRLRHLVGELTILHMIQHSSGCYVHQQHLGRRIRIF